MRARLVTANPSSRMTSPPTRFRLRWTHARELVWRPGQGTVTTTSGAATISMRRSSAALWCDATEPGIVSSAPREPLGCGGRAPTDGVDARIQAEPTPNLASEADLASSEAGGERLGACDDAVLPGRQLGDRPVGVIEHRRIFTRGCDTEEAADEADRAEVGTPDDAQRHHTSPPGPAHPPAVEWNGRQRHGAARRDPQAPTIPAVLEVGGVRLEARRIEGSEPTVVFLHEGLGSAGLWRDVPDRICAATGQGGLVYSRAGYGASDPVELPRPLSYLDDEAALLPAILDAAGIDRAILVGHSDGASIALRAAADDGATGSGRIAGVAVLAPHVDVEPANVDAIRQTGERYRTSDLRQRLARHHTHVDVAFRGWHDAWTDPGFARWSIVDKLPAITVPTLVVQGGADPYGSLRQARLIEEHAGGPVEVVVLEGCAHTPQRERPEETRAAVTRLIRRVAPLSPD